MSYAPIDILLVEDNPADVKLTLRAFEQNKLSNRVQVVRDGAEALDFLFRRGDFSDRRVDENPKLVLLDLKLPKVDGIDVLRHVKADPRTSSIPIVMLTSSREERDIVESYELGVNSYIVKPVDFSQFIVAMREIGTYWLLMNQLPPS